MKRFRFQCFAAMTIAFALVGFGNIGAARADDIEEYLKVIRPGDYKTVLKTFRDFLEARQRGDYQTALKIIRPLVEKGDAVAQLYFGSMYMSGQGVTQDDKEAFKWHLLSAQQGLADAQGVVGIAYQNGRGVGQDYILAYMWYELGMPRLAPGDEKIIKKNLDNIAAKMTAAQIAQAKDMAKKCKASNYKQCGEGAAW